MTTRRTLAVLALATTPVGCFDPAPSYPEAQATDGDSGHDGSGQGDDVSEGDGDDVSEDGGDDVPWPPGCEADTCSGHGVCSADVSEVPTCTCEPPYAGADCSGCAFGFQDHDRDGTCELGCDHPDAPRCDELHICVDQDGTADCECELEVDGECVAGQTLTVALFGDGRGEISVEGDRCDRSPCEFLLPRGSEVVVEATPRDALHGFIGWSGPCSNSEASCTVTLDEDVSLSATFQLRNNVVFVSAQALGVDQLAALPGPGLSVPQRADAWCAIEAMEAGLHGTQWVAWMVTSGTSVPERMGDARGWVSTDGRPIADRLQDVVEGALINPILFDQFGERHHVLAWTGADLEGGTDESSSSCEDWTSNSADDSVSAGLSGDVRFWAAGLNGICSEAAHIYCFGIDSSEPLPALPSVQGRIAFVSRGSFTPGNGRAVADALCQQEGSEQFEGTFVAALGTSTQALHERFDLTGPTWVRPDGQPILNAAADLEWLDRGISSIHQHADGAEAAFFEAPWVRTGGSCSGDPSRCCDDWQGVEEYTFAQSLSGDAFSSSGTSVLCSEAGRVFCLQQ